jgi:phage-related protein
MPRSVAAAESSPFPYAWSKSLSEDIWVVHAFQKKSTQGIKTPKREIDLVKDRLKRLKEMLR